MTNDLILPLAALAASVVGLGAASAALVRFEVMPALEHRRELRDLRAEVQRLADEYAATPPRRQRHDAHCPACGRFAVLVFDGERGRVTRCRAHGVLVKAKRRIGRPERVQPILVAAHRPIVDLGVRVGSLSFAVAEPARPLDWLDGEPTPGRAVAAVTPLRAAA